MLSLLSISGCDLLFSSGYKGLVIEHVSVIPMTSDTLLADRTVIVRGDSIQSISRSGEVAIPADCELINGAGKFLMPGMADMHARLPGIGSDSMEIPDWLFLQVAAGVTTVGIVDYDSTQLYIIGKIERGVYTGPALEFLDSGTSSPETRTFLLYAPRIDWAYWPLPGTFRYDENAWLYSGIDSFYVEVHLPVLDSLIRRPGVKYMPDHIVEKWFDDYTNQDLAQLPGGDTLKHIYDNYLSALRRAHSPHMPQVMLSPSKGLFIAPGFGMLQEMKHFRDAGINSFAILQAATVKPARFLKQSDKWGTIDPGKRADMVLLNSNPLENIENLFDIEGVVLRGKWLDHETREEGLDILMRKAVVSYENSGLREVMGH